MDEGKRKKVGRSTTRKITKLALKKAVDIVGGVTNLSLDIQVGHARVSAWLYTDERIPAEHVIKIVRATKGKVRPEELRSDIEWDIPEYPGDDGL
jgi:DNA-binding transcriptional regulator YdaS (Cro superfamily)